ncbi:MAG: tetratricopeptide repeat protein [Deltaproteobacteria bacterium]|nr:tetratricopeptide repeat protein [Deltaproteobacteria bacterium]
MKRLCIGLLAAVCVFVFFPHTADAGKPPVQASPRAVEHNNRGALLLEEGRLDQAEFELKTAIQLSPDYAEAYNNLGIVYKKRNQLDLALTHFQKAAALNKDYTAPLSHIGAIYITQGRYDTAIEILTKAINRERTFAYAVYNLGLAFLMKAREEPDHKKKEKWYAEAEKQLTDATQLNPKLLEAHLNLGDLYVERGDLEKAEIRFRLALEDNPNNPKIYQQLVNVLRQRGKTREANELQTRGQQVGREVQAKEHFEAGYRLAEEGENMAAEGKKDAARVAFQRAAQSFQAALKVKPKMPEATYALGVVQERLGNHAAARKSWEQTLALVPDHPGALFNLGTLAFHEGRTSEGLVDYCKFLRTGGAAYPQQRAMVEQRLREQNLRCPTS